MSDDLNAELEPREMEGLVEILVTIRRQLPYLSGPWRRALEQIERELDESVGRQRLRLETSHRQY